MTPTDAERKAAMEWLAIVAGDVRSSYAYSGAEIDQHTRTLKAMLAEPRLPEEPTADALRVMRDQISNYTPAQSAYQVYRALYAHLTKPATKTVQVWRVEYAEWSIEHEDFRPRCETFLHANRADDRAKELREWFMIKPGGVPRDYACIRVTGPHEQVVPA